MEQVVEQLRILTARNEALEANMLRLQRDNEHFTWRHDMQDAMEDDTHTV